MLKILHISSAILSISGFFVRGIWTLTDSALMQKKIVKIFPHVIDTILLASAILLVFETRLYPSEQAWLITKIIALIVYIFLGVVAFKLAKNKSTKTITWVLALILFLYIVAVARTHNTLLFY